MSMVAAEPESRRARRCRRAGRSRTVLDRRNSRHLEDDPHADALVVLDEPLGHELDSVDVDDVVRTELTGERYPVRDVIGREQTARTERPGEAMKSPTGPHPRTATARPASSCVAVANTALPKGSWRQASSGGIFRTVVLPYDGWRDDHVVGEPSVPIDAEDLRPLAHVRLARPAVEAGSARHVALG